MATQPDRVSIRPPSPPRFPLNAGLHSRPDLRQVGFQKADLLAHLEHVATVVLVEWPHTDVFWTSPVVERGEHRRWRTHLVHQDDREQRPTLCPGGELHAI